MNEIGRGTLQNLMDSQKRRPHHALLLQGNRFNSPGLSPLLSPDECCFLAQELCGIPLNHKIHSKEALQSHTDICLVGEENKSIKRDDIDPLLRLSHYAAVYGRKRFFCIELCENLTPGAANSLLKTLESPQTDAIFVLTTQSPNKVLPTILSRCLKWNFASGQGHNLSLEHLKQSGPWSEDDMQWLQSALDLCRPAPQPGGPLAQDLARACRHAERLAKTHTPRALIEATSVILKEQALGLSTQPQQNPNGWSRLRDFETILLEWNSCLELHPSSQLWLLRIALS